MDADNSEHADENDRAIGEGIERNNLAAQLQALAAQLRTLDYQRLDSAEDQALDALLKSVLECVDQTPCTEPVRSSAR
jgi:hypothetical protein